MTGPAVSVFCPAYNKGLYTLDTIRSVLAQTRPDWELWLLENSTDGATRGAIKGMLSVEAPDDPRIRLEEIDQVPRGQVNVMGWLLNRYYGEANGRYVFYLSDDDLVDPDCFEHMAGYLDAHPEHHVCWASLRMSPCAGPGDTGPFPEVGIPARHVPGPGGVDCRIDGGQIMHRKSCLAAVARPWFEEGPAVEIARHIDGIFMERLVPHFPFHPIDRWLITHRYTELSTFTPMTSGFTRPHQGA